MSTAITIGIPFAISAFERRTKIVVDARQIQNLHDAANTAAGIVTTQLHQGLIHLTEVKQNDPKILAIAQEALVSVIDSAKGQKITPQQMARLVVARADTAPHPIPASIAVATPP